MAIGFRWVLPTILLGIPAVAQAQPEQSGHWGIEGGFGRSFAPSSLVEVVQDRYSASLRADTYNFGLVRFHPNGAPSYSLQFSRSTLDGTAQRLGVADVDYQGSAVLSGFLATKHVNFAARRRFSMGLAFGAGIGPQLKVDYTRNATVNNLPFSERKTYMLKEIPVTPLFQVQIGGDVHLSRNVSAGPWVGLRNAVPVAGGVVRVHFLK